MKGVVSHRELEEIDVMGTMMAWHTCLSGSMLAKPPLWLAWPPLEAISRTSSLGLDGVRQWIVGRELGQLRAWRNAPVGEVAGVGVLSSGHGSSGFEGEVALVF